MTIFDFAMVTEWDGRLAELARIAEPERWTYLHIPSELVLPILDSYVRHTFLRVQAQKHIAFTDRMACFNTGLLTPSQEEIFAVFTIADHYDPERETGPTNKMWYLKAWIRAGERWLMEFGDLPQLATYWSDPAELVFDPSMRVELNVDHIVRDNLQRFPEELGGRLGRDGVPRDLEATTIDSKEADEVERLAPVSDIPLSARNALEGAMKHSIRLAQRSYRIAVPQFHNEKIQLLLPLFMRDASRADLALTLERVGNWYRAATILYTDWGYQHARLLSRPNSEWLGGFRSDVDPIAPT